MECPNCLQSYENFASGDNLSIPRILSQCGHSICHQCLVSLFERDQVQCPLCGIANRAESVSAFTKNLALLQAVIDSSQNQQQMMSSPQRKSYLEMPFDISQGSRSGSSKLDLSLATQSQYHNNSSSIQQNICQEHFKTIEAFCWTDRQALCIDCLLAAQNLHKNHEVLNIEKSMDKEETNLKCVIEKLNTSKGKIAQQQEILISFKDKLDQQELEQIQKITQFFNDIKEQIEQRQKRAFLQITNDFEIKRQFIAQNQQDIKGMQYDINHTDFQILSYQLSSQSQNQVEYLVNQIAKEKQASEIIEKIENLQFEIEANQMSQIEQFDFKSEIQSLQKIFARTQQQILSQSPLPKIQRRNSIQKSISNKGNETQRQSHRDLNQTSKNYQRKKDSQKPTNISNISKMKNNFFSEKPMAQNARAEGRLSMDPTKQQKDTSITKANKIQRQQTLKQEKLKQNQTPIKVTKPKQDIKEQTQIQNQTQKSQKNQRPSSRVLQTTQDSYKTGNRVSKIDISAKTPLPTKDITFEQSLRQANKGGLNKSTSKLRISQIGVEKSAIIEDLTPQIKSQRQNQLLFPQSSNTSRFIALNKSNVSESENEDTSSYASMSNSIRPTTNQHSSLNASQMSLKQRDISLKQFHSTFKPQNDLTEQKPFSNATNLRKNNGSQMQISSNSGFQTVNHNAQQVRPSLRDKRNNIKQEKTQSLQHQIEKEEWKMKQAQNVEIIAQARQLSQLRGDSSSRQISSTIQGFQNAFDQTLKTQRNSMSSYSIPHTIHGQNNDLNMISMNTHRVLNEKAPFEMYNDEQSNQNEIDYNNGYNDPNLYSVEQTPRELVRNLNELNMTQILNESKVQIEDQIGIIGGITESQDDDQGFEIELLGKSKKHRIIIPKTTKVQREGFKSVNDPQNLNSILIIGGKIKDQNQTQILSLDLKTNSILPELYCSLPEKFSEATYFAIANSSDSENPIFIIAYVTSAQDEQSQLTFLQYNYKDSKWESLGVQGLITEAISEFQIVICKSYLYLFGGHYDGIVSRKSFRYDLSQQNRDRLWEQIADMNEGRVHFSATQCEESLIVISGGYDGEKVLSSCEMYDAREEKFVQLAQMPSSRMYHSAIYTSTNKQILIYGGINNNQDVIAEAIELPVTDNDKQWQPSQQINNSKRFGHSIIKIS